MRFTAAQATFFLFTLPLLAASGAQAQERGVPVTYFVAFPADAASVETTSAVQAQLRARLMAEESINWLPPDQVFVAYRQAALDQLAEATRRLEEGQAAYLNLQLEDAVDALSAALTAFERATPVMEDADKLGETLLFLGASQVTLGQDRGARQTFRRLHQQLPGLRPDPQLFNPAVVTAYESAGTGLPTAGSITVRSDEGGAAFVDYRHVGRTPTTTGRLPAGRHVVRVTRPGHRPAVDSVSLRGGRNATIELSPEPGPDAAAFNRLSEQLAGASLPDQLTEGSAAASLVRLLGVDVLGLVRVSKENGAVALELAAYDGRNGERFLRSETRSPMIPAELREVSRNGVERAVGAIRNHWQEGTMEPQQFAAGSNDSSGGDEEDDGTIFEEWAFWVAVGAVVVGGGVATYLLLQDGDDETSGGQIVLRF